LIAGLSVIAFGTPGLQIPYIALLQAGRAQGAVGDPDFFAGMCLVFTPVALVVASEVKQKWARILFYGAGLTLLAGVFTSLSRGAYLATVLLGILFIVSRPERLFRSRREKAAALFVVALGVIGFFSRPYLRQEVVTRAQSIYAPKTQEEASGAGRTELWKGAIRTARENPILGVGYGSFAVLSQELILHTPGVNPLVFQKRNEGDNFVAHNTYLGTAAELGFTGLFLYLALLVATGLSLRRTSIRAVQAGAPFVGRIAHAFLLGLSAWAICTFFLNGETARTFWIVVGISVALPKLVPELASGRGRRYRTPSNAPRS
jgi:putative inorganic carbon (HCO3(-)) transporter